jgi:hypothetical protein
MEKIHPFPDVWPQISGGVDGNAQRRGKAANCLQRVKCEVNIWNPRAIGQQCVQFTGMWKAINIDIHEESGEDEDGL